MLETLKYIKVSTRYVLPECVNFSYNHIINKFQIETDSVYIIVVPTLVEKDGHGSNKLYSRVSKPLSVVSPQLLSKASLKVKSVDKS